MISALLESKTSQNLRELRVLRGENVSSPCTPWLGGEHLNALCGKKNRTMDFLIHHMLRTSAARFLEKEALVDKDMRLSYESVAKQVAGLAEGLRQAGLRRGDRVGLYLETSVLQSLSIFGVSQAGGVFVPINNLLFPEQVAHIAGDCQMRGLITTREKLDSLVPTLKGIPSLEFVVVTGDGPRR